MAKNKDQDPLRDALDEIEKELGAGAIMEGIEGVSGIANVEFISTGSIALDVALGIGGIPRGRITEIYGPEGGGKSTLALHLVANVQKSGGRAVYIDVEHAVDTAYAKSVGVDTKTLLFSQPDSAEQAFKIIEVLAKTGKVDVIILDSVAALATQRELAGDVEDNTIAEIARLMSKGLKRILSPINQNSVAMIFINQLRHKIGVTFGSNETTPGGRSLKFYASVRLDIRRIQGVKASGETDFIGNVVRVKAVKNKVAPPFRQAEFEIIFGEGINTHGSILDMAVDHKLIERRGSNYYHDGRNIANGRANAIKFLQEDGELSSELETAIKKVVLPHLFSEAKSDGQG